MHLKLRVIFKSNIQERFMLNALSSNDISAIQQNANALQIIMEFYNGVLCFDSFCIICSLDGVTDVEER